MGKNPSIIIKEQRAKARDMAMEGRQRGLQDDIVAEAAEKSGYTTCGYYRDLLQAFMIEGYTTIRAEKHIREWADLDLLSVFFVKGYKLVGYGAF